MAAVGVKHIYTQVDLSNGWLAARFRRDRCHDRLYTGGVVPAPWLTQASLAVDWAGLNPSPDEIATLKAKGFALEDS